MKSRDLGSNRFNTIRTDEFPKWDIDSWRRKYNEEMRKEQERLDKKDLDHINEFYKLTNFFIKEGMYLKNPTYRELRMAVYDNYTIFKKNMPYDCKIKEALRRIGVSKLKGNSPFIPMIEKLTQEDVKTFNNILKHHNQKKK